VFTESAHWYDRFQAGKDYAGEAERITGLIRDVQPRARTLLDVACGTGGHLSYFRRVFTCHGLGLDGGLLEVARQRLPDVPLTRADMTGFDLAQRFDAVTCLFSSIGYTASVAGLRAATGVMANHLNPVASWSSSRGSCPGRGRRWTAGATSTWSRTGTLRWSASGPTAARAG
jgi:SAM-dependent methyltransferase